MTAKTRAFRGWVALSTSRLRAFFGWTVAPIPVPTVDMAGFPKIGPIWTVPDVDNCPVEVAAKYNAVYLMGLYNPTYNAALRALNPNIKILGSAYAINACECPVYPDTALGSWPAINAIGARPEWMLANVGSTLASGINATDTTVTPAAMTTAATTFPNQALTDSNADGIPDSFTVEGQFSTATITDSATGGHSGGRVVRIQTTTGVAWGSLDDLASVTAGDRLYPSVWLKGTGTGTHLVTMEVRSDTALIEYVDLLGDGADGGAYLALDGTWYHKSRYYTVPSGATSARLHIQRTDGTSGTSDISFSDFTNSTIPMFDVGKLVTIGGTELCRVSAVGDTTLTLDKRGIGPAGASSHASGARIAQVVTMWGDTTPVMDVSDDCPTADVGHGSETWRQFCTRTHIEALAASDFDGIVLDRADSNESWLITAGKTRNIDVDRSNTLVTDYTAFDAAWNAGQSALVDAIRAGIGNAVLIANQPYPNANLDGAYFEEQPTDSWDLALWNLVVRGPYDASHKSLFDTVSSERQPPYTHMGTYSYAANTETTPHYTHAPDDNDYRLMRWGLTSCLLVGAAFVWEPRNNHSTFAQLWADEFDNAGAGKGYLGHPHLDAPTLVEGVVWRRDYEHGTVLCNPTDADQTITIGDPLLSGYYTRINGTQQPAINDGTNVSGDITIPAHDGLILLGENYKWVAPWSWTERGIPPRTWTQRSEGGEAWTKRGIGTPDWTRR